MIVVNSILASLAAVVAWGRLGPSPSANDHEGGLHEMSFLGSLHVAAAVLSLAVAAIVLARTKGTPAHVRLGRAYVVLLVLVDTFALLTYQSGVGPFHLLAVISLATLTAGLVWSPRRRGSRQTHGILMIWSVTGLVGAGLAQGATAVLPRADRKSVV